MEKRAGSNGRAVCVGGRQWTEGDGLGGGLERRGRGRTAVGAEDGIEVTSWCVPAFTAKALQATA